MSDAGFSPISKFQEGYGRFTDIGAFGDGLDQQSYIEQYLPSSFLEMMEGRLLVDRMAYWLNGR